MQTIHDLLANRYPVNQYMVIIHPPDNIIKRVRRVREGLQKEDSLQPFQLRNGFFLLAKFSQFAIQEQKVMDKVHHIAMEATPFLVQLEDYVSQNNQAVCIGVKNSGGFAAIIQKMKLESRFFKNSHSNPVFYEQPLINVVNRMATDQFQRIWKKMKGRRFHASFVANQLMVLRKSPNQAGWTVLDTLPLQNLPVYSRQGVLFA